MAARSRAGRLLAALLGLGGVSISGCRGPDCDNDTAPEGTRFRIEVLEELSNSEGCHLFAAQPGEAFFLTAGPTVEVGGEEGYCPVTKAAGPPEGAETDFVYVGECSMGRGLSSSCDVRFPELCPGVANAGYTAFTLKGSELFDAQPSKPGSRFIPWSAMSALRTLRVSTSTASGFLG